MAAPLLSALPARFDAGTTVKYLRTHGAYPASLWALAVQVSGAAQFTVAGVPNGDAWDVTIPATQTATVTSVTDASTTAASKVLGQAAGNFVTDGVRGGDLVTGPGIPRGAYVDPDYPIAATTLTLSEAATATGTGLAVKFRFPDGVYAWKELVTLAGEVYVAASGTVIIAPAVAGQSWEARMLPIVEDILEGKIATDTASYQIADRAKTALGLESMLAFRGYLQAALRGQGNPGQLTMVRASFTGASAEA